MERMDYLNMKEAGARTIAQDEKSLCGIWHAEGGNQDRCCRSGALIGRYHTTCGGDFLKDPASASFFLEIFAMMSVLKTIIESGVTYTTTSQDKRNVVMTNNLSLALAAMLSMLIVARSTFLVADPSVIVRLILGIFLCLLPIVLNRGGYIWASRFLLCWAPPILIFALFVIAIRQRVENEASAYIGLRFFLLLSVIIHFSSLVCEM